MTNPLPQEIQQLQARIATAQRERDRAEGARAVAQSAVTEARNELERDFGVATIEDAQAMLAKLRRDLDAIMTSIAAQLDHLGNP